MVIGVIIGSIIAGIGIGICTGLIIIAKGCEVLNERIEKGY